MGLVFLFFMKNFFFALLFVCFWGLPFAALAQDAPPSSSPSAPVFNGIIPASQTENDLGDRINKGTLHLSDIPLVVVHLIDIATQIAGTIAVIFIMFSGLQFMLSGVAESKEKAKTTLKWALIGLVVTFLAWVAVNLVQVQLTS